VADRCHETHSGYQEETVSTRADKDVTASELRRYAFHMEPQLEETEESWTAAYPGANWSASGRSRAEALQRLGEEFMQRQNAGEDPLAYAEGVYRGTCASLLRVFTPLTTSSTASWSTHPRPSVNARLRKQSAGVGGASRTRWLTTYTTGINRHPDGPKPWVIS
jgi:hypothetical protein